MTLTKDLEVLYTITGKTLWVVTAEVGWTSMYELSSITVIKHTGGQNHPITNTFVNKKIINRRQ
jgi:hypothetical protein